MAGTYITCVIKLIPLQPRLLSSADNLCKHLVSPDLGLDLRLGLRMDFSVMPHS